VFFSAIGRIGTGDPMLGALPGHSQAAQGQPKGFVADQARRQALGETDLGGQGERPPAGRLAKRPRTLGQEGPEGCAGPCIEPMLPLLAALCSPFGGVQVEHRSRSLGRLDGLQALGRTRVQWLASTARLSRTSQDRQSEKRLCLM
jgi:hypothetical protein